VRRLAVVAGLALAGGLAYTAAGGGTAGRVAGAVVREALRMIS
jgi:hypothetical protein